MKPPIVPDDDPVSMSSERTMRGGDPDALGRIDQYKLLRRLGGGGFGVVYLARDSVSGVEVAIKTLHPLLKNNAEEMDLLREKFKLVHGLTHPNIAKALVLHLVREINVWDAAARAELKLSPGDSVMVMDYAPGITLSKWRRQFPGGVVPPDLALEVGRQVAAALDYAHAERIVHRDVKPSNIMVETLRADEPRGAPDHEGETARAAPEPQGSVSSVCSVVPKIRVRLLDFGLAAEIRSSMARVSTEQGDTSGTRPYMAPEQWLGRKQDGRTDQYALACVLYELLSGAPPFAAVFETGDPAVMMAAVKSEAPAAVDAIPSAANAALLRALAKDPGTRFPNCTAFVEDVGRALRASCGGAPTWRRRARLFAAAALVIVGTLGAQLLPTRRGAGGEAPPPVIPPEAEPPENPERKSETPIIRDSGETATESESHTESAEGTDTESHAEDAEPESHAESAKSAESESHAEGAKSEPSPLSSSPSPTASSESERVKERVKAAVSDVLNGESFQQFYAGMQAVAKRKGRKDDLPSVGVVAFDAPKKEIPTRDYAEAVYEALEDSGFFLPSKCFDAGLGEKEIDFWDAFDIKVSGSIPRKPNAGDGFRLEIRFIDETQRNIWGGSIRIPSDGPASKTGADGPASRFQEDRP